MYRYRERSVALERRAEGLGQQLVTSAGSNAVRVQEAAYSYDWDQRNARPAHMPSSAYNDTKHDAERRWMSDTEESEAIESTAVRELHV